MEDYTVNKINKNEIHYFVYGCDQLKKDILDEIKSAIEAELSGKTPQEYLLEKNATYLIKEIESNLTVSYVSAIYVMLRDRVITFTDEDAIDKDMNDYPF